MPIKKTANKPRRTQVLVTGGSKTHATSQDQRASRAARRAACAAAGVVGGLGERLTALVGTPGLFCCRGCGGRSCREARLVWFIATPPRPPPPGILPPRPSLRSGLAAPSAPGFALRARATAHVFQKLAGARFCASRRTQGLAGPRCGVEATSASDNGQDSNQRRLARVAEASLARAHSSSACARNARLAVRLDPASRPGEPRCAYEHPAFLLHLQHLQRIPCHAVGTVQGVDVDSAQVDPW